jgi:hypothetical protein
VLRTCAIYVHGRYRIGSHSVRHGRGVVMSAAENLTGETLRNLWPPHGGDNIDRAARGGTCFGKIGIAACRVDSECWSPLFTPKLHLVAFRWPAGVYVVAQYNSFGCAPTRVRLQCGKSQPPQRLAYTRVVPEGNSDEIHHSFAADGSHSKTHTQQIRSEVNRA